MKYEILYQPTFSVARILLDLGMGVRAESGAMVSMSPTVELQSKAAGGLGKVFGRMLGGESVFQSTYTAKQGPGEVILAPATPGDIMPIHLQGNSLVVSSGCYLAGDLSLEMETITSVRGLFGGEGLFMLRMKGVGTLLISAFGAIHTVQLQPGHQYMVDSGHVVAFTDGMQHDVTRAARGLLGSLTSGEGFVFRFSGPGTIYIQTRTPAGFAGWLSRFMPARG